MLKFDGKVEETDPIFGEYNITIGVRVYSNETDTTPKSLSAQSFKIEFTQPEDDLSTLYEEDVPAETSETIVYFDEKFRFKNSDITTDASLKGFQTAKGGYKLYGSSSGATDRWFIDLALELPTVAFTDGLIIYQWITYEDSSQSDDYSGAVACKITVGDTSATSVDQWIGVTNMSSESD